jgi:hypothetical protein
VEEGWAPSPVSLVFCAARQWAFRASQVDDHWPPLDRTYMPCPEGMVWCGMGSYWLVLYTIHEPSPYVYPPSTVNRRASPPRVTIIELYLCAFRCVLERCAAYRSTEAPSLPVVQYVV